MEFCILKQITVVEGNNTFIHNKAYEGAVMYVNHNQLLHSRNSFVAHNEVTKQGVVVMDDTNAYYSGTTNFYNNSGTSLTAIGCRISFYGKVNFTLNFQLRNKPDMLFAKGGAINLVQSEIVFNATVTMHRNIGVNGGAFFSINSKIIVTGHLTLSNNNAAEGGGMNLHQSELLCWHSVIFLENKANTSGGGIIAVSSFIRLSHQGSLLFMRNFAQQNGGGIFLTGNSKITVLHHGYTAKIWDLRIRLINNMANYGGGIYVDDDSSTALLCSEPNDTIVQSDYQCFIQTSTYALSTLKIRFEVLLVNKNKAAKAGVNIFGGFLHRCRHTPLLAARSALQHLQLISNIKNLSSISSKPMKLCLCREKNQPECDQKQLNYKKVTRGRDFNLLVVALDQVNNALNATILPMEVMYNVLSIELEFFVEHANPALA